jgi:hypothetical protein
VSLAVEGGLSPISSIPDICFSGVTVMMAFCLLWNFAWSICISFPFFSHHRLLEKSWVGIQAQSFILSAHQLRIHSYQFTVPRVNRLYNAMPLTICCILISPDDQQIPDRILTTYGMQKKLTHVTDIQLVRVNADLK